MPSRNIRDIEPLPPSCGGPSFSELRRLDTGELPRDDRERMRAHTDTCQRCQATLRDFAADRVALQVAMPFAALERRVGERSTGWRRLWPRFALAFSAPIAAVAALIVFAPRAPSTDGATAGTRTKGGASLDFVVKSGDVVHDGRDGDQLREGDSLRFRYSSGGLPYVLIVGVDADGKVFPYLSAGDRSAPAGAAAALAPNAIMLDADRRPERVFALYSRDPIGVDEVRPAVRDALEGVHGRIDQVTHLPGFPSQATLLLNKATQ